MTQEQRIAALATAIGDDIQALLLKQGDLTTLTTTAKTNLVSAINEVRTFVQGGGTIDDAAPSTTKTYSSSKINTLVSTAVNNIVNGAPAAFDTLKEISDALADDDNQIGALMTAVGNRVRYDAVQVLTAPQMAQVNANIGSASLVQIGNPDADFVAVYNTAKTT